MTEHGKETQDATATRPRMALYEGEEKMPSCASHDYDPAWDYEVSAAPSGKQLFDLDLAMESASNDLLEPLGFPGALIFLVRKGGLGTHTLGKYINGTSSFPVIGVDLPSLNVACRKVHDEPLIQIKATLAHELGHAWLEARCADENLIEDEETVVENFAYEWVVHGNVCVDILEKAVLTEHICNPKY